MQNSMCIIIKIIWYNSSIISKNIFNKKFIRGITLQSLTLYIYIYI